MIKRAMIRLHHLLAKLESKMIMQVHDELVFECPAQEKKDVEALVKKEMECVWPMQVPVVVHLNWGKNWDEAH
jgi:DNA polymerase-1